MKKLHALLFASALAVVLSTQPLYAEEEIAAPDTTPPVITAPTDQTLATSTLSETEELEAESPLSIDAAITLPYSCEVVDTDGIAHAFPEEDSASKYLAICALQEAKDQGIIENLAFINDPSFGLYLNTINDLLEEHTYWAVYLNGGYTDCGVGCIPITTGDELSFVLTNFVNGEEGATVKLRIVGLLETPEEPEEIEEQAPAPSAGGGGGFSHSQLSVQSALAFLANVQRPDGSFESPLLTDWAALAFAAADPGGAKTNLRAYLLTAAPALSSVTDYQRHAMALLALGIDPYVGTPVDYIAPITSAFDGVQIGDAALDNDDIFALFPLLRSGYSASDDIIQKTVAFIISRQAADGSWDSSVDITAAGVQALSQVQSVSGVPETLAKAKQYLKAEQQSNGGWGNSFSTSWALQAIAAFGESADMWAPNGLTANDYLASLQQSDGGLELVSASAQNRTWATEYAIPASLGRHWLSLLQSFPKPAGGSAGSGLVLGASTSTQAATSTILIATSTPPTASSTPEILEAVAPTENQAATTTATSTIQAAVVARKNGAKSATVAPVQTTPAQSTSTTPTSNGNSGFLHSLWKTVISFFAELL